MTKLSVAIITFNEENKIRKALESVKAVADEIVVVDSFSTDATESICNEYDVNFIKNKFDGYVEQKNFALSQCSNEIVLSIDADEALSETLAKSIKNAKANWKGDGFRFNRLTNYAGHWVKHCGWYPDTKLRLVSKGQAKWEGYNPHDILKLTNGTKGTWLSGDLEHYSYDSVTDHVNQTNKFTSINAKASFENGVRSSLLKIVMRPPLKFIRDYIFKLGFLDGRYGFMICYINALSAFLKYSKIYELQNQKEI